MKLKQQNHCNRAFPVISVTTVIIIGFTIIKIIIIITFTVTNLIPRAFLRRGEDGPILSLAEKNPGNEVALLQAPSSSSLLFLLELLLLLSWSSSPSPL